MAVSLVQYDIKHHRRCAIPQSRHDYFYNK